MNNYHDGSNRVDSVRKHNWCHFSRMSLVATTDLALPRNKCFRDYFPAMFRLPTHLETFIPPPSQQVPQARPWRGTFILSTELPASSSQSLERQEIFCTAAETEGDNEVERWPENFCVNIMNGRGLVHELKNWIKNCPPPLCMFMPDRLPDQDAHRQNHASFEALAQTLADHQCIAFAPWNAPDTISGAGVIIFPTASSRALLVGALYIHSNFPDFIGQRIPSSRPHHTFGLIPRPIPYNRPSGNNPYDPAPPNIASSQRHNQGSSSSIGRYVG